MKKRFFIIMGRSGSGKGTQSELLKKRLEEKSFDDVQHMTTGGGFRAFNEKEGYTPTLLKAVNNNGGLSPNFLAIWIWTTIFIDTLKENTTVILDGVPRKLIEVEALHDAIAFYGYEKPTVIYVDVSEGWATERLTSRDREDDAKKEDRERKMQWFFEETLPCVASYKNNPGYEFIHVSGEKSIEEVHEDILSKLASFP